MPAAEEKPMSKITWNVVRGFIAEGSIDGAHVARVVMREPGTYLAETQYGSTWCETKKAAVDWCEASVASASAPTNREDFSI